jgi:cytochrome P450
MKSALQNPAVFSSQKGAYRDTSQEFALLPGEVDPPVHRKYRTLVNPAFSPGQVVAREPEIRRICVELIESFLDRRSCEFMNDFASATRQVSSWACSTST